MYRKQVMMLCATRMCVVVLAGTGVLFAVLISSAVALDITPLHTFTGGSNDGATPYGSLIRNGSTLYGATGDGGTYNAGTIFSIDTNGSNFTLLHSFAGGSGGDRPYGSLMLNGSTLYGTTEYGGNGSGSGNGTVFSIGTNGTGFTSLHAFNGDSTEGIMPCGTLALVGSNLYGVASQGGINNNGTIFSIGTNGSGFATIHSYSFDGSDGRNPMGVTASGSMLYGTTYEGGSSNNGTIFSIDTAAGNDFDVLRSFAGGSNDGAKPTSGDLTISGSTLFGATSRGGSEGDVWSTNGTLFSIGTNGSDFQLVHAFTGGGGGPNGGLAISGSELLGMTQLGGTNGTGTIFRVGTDGNDFTSLHSFSGNDGAYPYGGVILDGSTIYGMSTYGGSNNVGVLFSATPEPSTLILLLAGAAGFLAYAWRRRMARD